MMTSPDVIEEVPVVDWRGAHSLVVGGADFDGCNQVVAVWEPRVGH